MKRQEEKRNTFIIESSLYVLKHKDLDVAMVQIDAASGKIEYILEVYLPEELPVGCDIKFEKGAESTLPFNPINGQGLVEWWESRAIPDSRRGIQQVLHYLQERTNLSLMLSAYGLSLTDHYWMQPIGQELYWKDLNFYENDFSDELGNLLTESEKVNMDTNISKFSPSSSINGEMKKKWVMRDGTRYLMKVNANDYGQQAVNEVIACRMHERLEWENYVPYTIEKVLIEGIEYPCSLNPLFTSLETEFVSGYQLIQNYKVPNTISNFEAMIQRAVEWGMKESEVRRQLEYTIMTDFLLSNTDRHFNNFGFLYEPQKHMLTSMAPIFDTGNALFYNRDIIPSNDNLLEIAVSSFCKREVDMLRYVQHTNLVELGKLQGFPDEAEDLLIQYTGMPAFRAANIARTIGQKMEYLKLFQQEKKIWKKEKYW